jgi:hypothetical protein
VTASAPGTAVQDAGVLGRPTTTILFDQDNLDNGAYSGGRFTVGFWFPCYSDLGLEASYFFLGQRSGSFTAASNGSRILARPFVDAITGNEISQLVAFPNLISGQVTVDHSTRLWGVELNLRHKLLCGPCFHLDLLYGYRHLELQDALSINENLAVNLGDGQSLGIAVRDSFESTNSFNGGQIGLELEHRLFRRWFVNWHGKIAFGNNHQVINVNGTTTFSSVSPGVANPQPAGVAALGTNIGQHERDRFAVLPELGVKIGVDVTEHLRLWIGYDILWLSDAVRAGEQIDRTINRSQLPSNVSGIGPLVGPARPLVPFRTQDFWAQGLNFGLSYRY